MNWIRCEDGTWLNLDTVERFWVSTHDDSNGFCIAAQRSSGGNVLVFKYGSYVDAQQDLDNFFYDAGKCRFLISGQKPDGEPIIAPKCTMC